MLDCKQATRLASQAMEKPLPLRQRMSLRLHLLMCDACTQFVRQLHLLREALAHFGRRVENDDRLRLSKEARARIAEAMAAETRRSGEVQRNPDQNPSD